MKKNYIIMTIILLFAKTSFGQIKVDVMAEHNPKSKCSAYLNKEVQIHGVIHLSIINKKNALFFMGRNGRSTDPENDKTLLTILIDEKDMNKFTLVKLKDLSESYAYVTGKIIYYRGKIALQLKDSTKLHFGTFRGVPEIR